LRKKAPQDRLQVNGFSALVFAEKVKTGRAIAGPERFILALRWS
jgi:hypothetical protein